MSAFAGILRFDGDVVDRVTLERMSNRLALRGYDTALHVDGSCGVIGGRAGVVHRDGALLVAFDGRLDNRDELLGALHLPESLTDSAIVAAAFRAWDNGCIERLDGDFAIAIVDLAAQRVLCARDRFAVRTLFYRIDPKWVAFATSIDSLTAGIEPMPGVNEGMAAEYLSSFIVSVHDTLFENVYRVPPSHQAALALGRHQLSEYWTPSPAPLDCSCDEEYDERLRELLRSAVTARLRGTEVAGIMLSGGLDSSAVTGMAAEVMRGGTVSTASIETFAGSVPGHDDERAYADTVSTRWGLTAHVVQERRPAPGQFASEIELDLEPQMFPHSPTVDGMRALARSRGIRVMLTGNGADDWFGSGPGAYADLFARGRLIALAQRLHSDAGTDLFAGWRLALQGVVWPLLPEAAREGVRSVLRRGQAPRWVDRDFATRVSLEERLARFRGRRIFATRELDDNWFQSVHGIRVHAFEIVTRGGDRFGLELAHPFFDRRIVEFGLALPASQLWQDGQTKVLLRRAMRGYLPDAVAARRGSPSADHAFLHAITAEAGERPFANLECERRGWIDGNEVRRMWAALQIDPTRAAYLGRILWGILAVELWLHARTMVKYPLSPGSFTRA